MPSIVRVRVEGDPVEVTLAGDDKAAHRIVIHDGGDSGLPLDTTDFITIQQYCKPTPVGARP